MCGRFVRDSSVPAIVKAFDIDDGSVDLEPSYNVAPSQDIAIVVNDGKKRLILCRWGLIPQWAKESSVGFKMINARAESVADKPSFKNAFKKQRCLVVANGFYEWKREGTVKIPQYVRLKTGEPFGFAGLFTNWTSPEGERMCTSTIVTTEANELMKRIHHRMPVIIPKDNRDLWLNTEEYNKDKLLALLKPHDVTDMEVYEVSTKVNSPAYNAPECVKPVRYI